MFGLRALILCAGMMAGCAGPQVRLNDPATRIVWMTPDGVRVCHPQPGDSPADIRKQCGEPLRTLDFHAPGRGGQFRHDLGWAAGGTPDEAKWSATECWVFPTEVADTGAHLWRDGSRIHFSRGRTPEALAVCFAKMSSSDSVKAPATLRVDAVLPLRTLDEDAVPMPATAPREAAASEAAPSWHDARGPRVAIAFARGKTLHLCGPAVGDAEREVTSDCGTPLARRPFAVSARHRVERMEALSATHWEAQDCAIYPNLMAPLVPQIELGRRTLFARGTDGLGTLVCYARTRFGEQKLETRVDLILPVRRLPGTSAR